MINIIRKHYFNITGLFDIVLGTFIAGKLFGLLVIIKLIEQDF